MPASGRIGAALHEIGAPNQLAAIELADRLGVSTAWLTTGGAGPDAMAIFAAAAVRTDRIALGTAIIPIYPRHPLNLVQQATVIASLAPGRLRLGVGPSHRPSVEGSFGYSMDRPLEYLREYVTILRAALHEGKVAFEGQQLTARAEVPLPPGAPKVPILVSALRPASYRLAGEVSDGALAWVSPLPYLKEKALPALQRGAKQAGRERPPLVAHCFACVHEDAAAVRANARERLAIYARLPFYQEMFALAGFPEAREGSFSDAMLDAVVHHGDEATVAAALNRYLEEGMDELIVSTLVIGQDRHPSLGRPLRLLATL